MNLHFLSSLANMGLWIAYAFVAAAFVKKYSPENKSGMLWLSFSFAFVSLIAGIVATLEVGLPDVGLGVQNFMYVFGSTSLMAYFYLPRKNYLERSLTTFRPLTGKRAMSANVSLMKGGVANGNSY